MTVPDPFTERLRAIASREGTAPDDVLRRLLDEYENRQSKANSANPIEDFISAFDDDVTDLSETAGQTLCKTFRA
ncbi:MAG: hypothetical protein AAF787_12195 [Chloroflexota bacterium]